jgi:nucleoside-diphosphate-sugar epimerase
VGEHRSAMIRFVSNLARGRPIEVHRGSVRSWLHVSDAVRAIEAATRVDEYAVINLGHPEVIPMADLAEMIRAELNASPELVVTTELPPKMTLIKRPTLDRQRSLLRYEPFVGIAEGVRRVCARHRRPALDEVPDVTLAAEF